MKPPPFEIRDAELSDAAVICDIYNVHVNDTIVTFEEVPIEPEEMAGRIERVQANYPWIVLVSEGRVVAYAYAAQWRERIAYRYAAETAIYVAEDAQGHGFGATLYQALVDRTREAGFKHLLGGIALPNDASVSLHEKLGFVKIGVFPRVGLKFERWIDVGFWQLEL